VRLSLLWMMMMVVDDDDDDGDDDDDDDDNDDNADDANVARASYAAADTTGLEFSLFIAGDIEPSFLSPSTELSGALPQPLTRMCLCYRVSGWSYIVMVGMRLTFKASFLEKLLSQCPQGKGFTARWIRLCRLRSWLRLKLWGHWSHLKGLSF
jgi:hypothetical protein